MGAADLLLGIDIGTYGSKGVLITEDGTVVASAARSHDMDRPRPGWAEQDADAVWWHDFCEIAQELTALARSRDDQIVGLAPSAIGPTCLPVDAGGRPLRPSLLYGIDTRAAREIEMLEEELGPERVLEVCGNPLTSQAIGPKVLWLQRHEPQVWEQTAKVLTAHSYLVQRLTGRYVVDAYSASAHVPFFDIRSRDWHGEFVSALGADGRLPEVVQSADVVGEVTREAAEATGLTEGTPVAAGTIDAAAEALSVGVASPGDMMVMYGTTAFMIQVLSDVVVSPRLWSGVWVDPRHAIMAGGMATTGAITEWMRRELTDLDAEAAFEHLFAEAELSPPGANGLLVLPYFSGERTPVNEPRARGVIAGLSLSSTRGDLLRGVVEAMGFGVRHHIDAMGEAGARPARLVAIGGGTRSRMWVQAVSDITGMAQDLTAERAGAAYGDALLAAVAIGVLPDVEAISTIVDVVDRVRPDRDLSALYEPRYEAYRELFEVTRPLILSLTAEREDP